jgi:hypothetical protein
VLFLFSAKLKINKILSFIDKCIFCAKLFRLKKYFASSTLIAFLAIGLFMVNALFHPGRPAGPSYELTGIYGDIVYTPELSDTMPHYLFKKIQDSLNRITEPKREQAHVLGTGTKVGAIGTYEYKESNSSEYYLSVGDFYLDYEVVFYRQEGKNYYKYPKWGKPYDNGTSIDGHYEKKETNLKFIEENKETGDGIILIQTTKTTKKVIEIILLIIGGIVILLWLYVIFGVAVHFLLSIARGAAFTEDNIFRLHFIAYVFIGTILFTTLMKIIGFLFVARQLPDLVHFSWYNVLMSGWEFLVAGLVTLLFAKAFKRGYQLQQEQQLTV